MQYDDFVGQVQNLAHLPSMGDAVGAIHATLLTLGERLYGHEADSLASQLPREIGTYLTEASLNQAFSVDEFFARIADRERADLPDAVYHARAVLAVLQQAVSSGEIADMRAQLPTEFQSLFDAGTAGDLDLQD